MGHPTEVGLMGGDVGQEFPKYDRPTEVECEWREIGSGVTTCRMGAGSLRGLKSTPTIT
jgi:hypothetical protein